MRGIKWFIIALFFAIQGFCETINTFYGPLEIQEPVLLELIHSPAFQRLKFIHQYGVAYYTTHREEYTRFDHSLGVLAILKAKGASLEEQIAGLLHDVSHTVFSHVGDWVFGKEYQDADYQSTIYTLYLATSGIEKILNRNGLSIEQISPKKRDFVMLEQPLPNLCADRIEYNIQGAYYQKFITKEEALELFHNFSFEGGKWVATRVDLVTKIAHFSLFMTEHCWGSAENFLMSRWLADAILQGIKSGLISWNEFHFGIDQEVWDKLLISNNPEIRNKMHMVVHFQEFCHIVSPHQAKRFVLFKCRGIDPWIKQGTTLMRLSQIDKELGQALQELKEKSKQGWPLDYTYSE